MIIVTKCYQKTKRIYYGYIQPLLWRGKEYVEYGVPVVASKTGSVPDAVKEGVSGEFTNPTNPESIAEKIFYLIKNEDKFYNPSINWAKKFDVKKIAEKFAGLYNKIEKSKLGK